MKVTLAVAESRRDILRCQALIAQIYNREYEVFFSADRYDLEGKVEPWPHRYLMGLVDGELACAAGLYAHSTYVERFGAVSPEEIAALRVSAGCPPESPVPAREITKLVVNPAFRGHGLSSMIMGSAHARAFLHPDEPVPDLLLCSKRSLIRTVHRRAGITPRHIKPFPIYKIHELYASPSDPMDSYLILPELDVPPALYHRKIPGTYEVGATGGGQR